MSISTVNPQVATLTRYRFVAVGSETSVSGIDANDAVLAYVVGKEQVYLNGVLLVRGAGQDYTATNGTSITGLSALAANDVVEVLTFSEFVIANAVDQNLVNAKGDLIVATADNTVTNVAVGANNTVLTADSAEATGLKWATPTGMTNPLTTTGDTIYSSSGTTPARLGIGSTGNVLTVAGGVPSWAAPAAGGGLTLLSTTNLSGPNTQITSINQSYKNLVVWLRNAYANGGSHIFIGASSTTAIAVGISGTSVATRSNIETPIDVGTSSSVTGQNSYFKFHNYADATYGKTFQWYGNANNTAAGAFLVTGVWNSASTVTVLEVSVQGIGVSWSGGQVLIYGEN